MSARPARSARFETAFELHHRRVLAFALRRSRGEADAEDAVAETFAVAWRRIDDLPDGDEALPWLLAIARRVLANQRRGSGRLSALIERLRAQPRPAPVPPPPPDSPATEALGRLRPDEQELLSLIAWEDLSHAEAAVVLGISVNAVAIRLHRARRRLAAELVKGSVPSRTSMVVTGSTVGERDA